MSLRSAAGAREGLRAPRAERRRERGSLRGRRLDIDDHDHDDEFDYPLDIHPDEYDDWLKHDRGGYDGRFLDHDRDLLRRLDSASFYNVGCDYVRIDYLDAVLDLHA